jgi:tartrate dehydrogenase/decarboxylase/D-malate dehydrogenase
MLPDDRKDQIGGHDAIYFALSAGPTKFPTTSLWGSLLMFRREFDQYINLRVLRAHRHHRAGGALGTVPRQLENGN